MGVMIRTVLGRLHCLRGAVVAVATVLTAPTTLQAADSGHALLGNRYWAGFVDFWDNQFKKQDSIVMMVIGVGILSVFIITRGKWRK